MKLGWKIIKAVVFILLGGFFGWFEDLFTGLRRYFENKADKLK